MRKSEVVTKRKIEIKGRATKTASILRTRSKLLPSWTRKRDREQGEHEIARKIITFFNF